MHSPHSHSEGCTPGGWVHTFIVTTWHGDILICKWAAFSDTHTVMNMGHGEIRSYYKAGLKPFSWSVLIFFLPYCLPDDTSSHSDPAAGQEGARLSRACRVWHKSMEQRKSRRHPWVVTNYRPLSRGPGWSQHPALSVPKPSTAKLHSELLCQAAAVADTAPCPGPPRTSTHGTPGMEGPNCSLAVTLRSGLALFSGITKIPSGKAAKSCTVGGLRKSSHTCTLSSHRCCGAAFAAAPAQSTLPFQPKLTQEQTKQLPPLPADWEAADYWKAGIIFNLVSICQTSFQP